MVNKNWNVIAEWGFVVDPQPLAFSADAYTGCINNIAAELKKSINICHCVN